MKVHNIKISLIAAVASSMMFASCGEPLELAYIKDAPRNVEVQQSGQFSKGIQSNDLLYIYVESRAPEATVRFNQETNKIAVDGGAVMNPGASAVTGYLVNNEGDIIFPVLGKIHVLGKTHAELAAEIERRLVGEGHILDAVVTVKLMKNGIEEIGSYELRVENGWTVTVNGLPIMEDGQVVEPVWVTRKDGTTFQGEVGVCLMHLTRGENLVFTIRNVEKRMAEAMRKAREQLQGTASKPPPAPRAVLKAVSHPTA